MNLVGVKVLSNEGTGPNSGVVDGIEWVLQQALNDRGRPRVANLSLGGSFSLATNRAVETLVEVGGVFTAVAAGNENAVACGASPASAASVVSVGATDSKDQRADFSNFGTCVDIFGTFATVWVAVKMI